MFDLNLINSKHKLDNIFDIQTHKDKYIISLSPVKTGGILKLF